MKAQYFAPHQITDALKPSLDSRSVPMDWKEANVIPLFKKEGAEKAENDRSVSLNSGGLLESVLKM